MKQCKNLKVFFCGTVPLFAHFISCYRGMSLTSVDFLMCLGCYISRITNCELEVLLLLLQTKLIQTERNTTHIRSLWSTEAENQRFCGQPAVRALLQRENCSIFTYLHIHIPHASPVGCHKTKRCHK